MRNAVVYWWLTGLILAFNRMRAAEPDAARHRERWTRGGCESPPRPKGLMACQHRDELDDGALED